MASFEHQNSVSANHNSVTTVTTPKPVETDAELESIRKEEIEALLREIQCLTGNISRRREKLSITIEDILNYCFNNAEGDLLLCPSQSHSDDPFRKKKSCALI
ncbi:hypothetical protein Ciccas_002040 [Cichlidogyrus casuarinus]|uniref:G protein gamma domain-containing protein n=1 Tax=Cichlidogyrus casuarinus TaxID=1844966 RepID=A0ABD2QIL8_9PLAT